MEIVPFAGKCLATKVTDGMLNMICNIISPTIADVIAAAGPAVAVAPIGYLTGKYAGGTAGVVGGLVYVAVTGDTKNAHNVATVVGGVTGGLAGAIVCHQIVPVAGAVVGGVTGTVGGAKAARKWTKDLFS